MPKDVKGLVGATSKKTAALRLGEELTVCRAREGAQDPDASTCLARFIMAVAEDLLLPWLPCQIQTWQRSKLAAPLNRGEKWRVLGSVQQGWHVVPAVGVDTTAKHRSLLHGQCYNKGKCPVTVKGADRLCMERRAEAAQRGYLSKY